MFCDVLYFHIKCISLYSSVVQAFYFIFMSVTANTIFFLRMRTTFHLKVSELINRCGNKQY